MKMKEHHFHNGFTFIYEKSAIKIPVTSIYAFVNVGSIFENDNTRGASHFVEHMCFKGTKKIPKPKQISVQFDEIGAIFNAYTEKRFTCYTIQTQDTYIEHCLTILSDMLFNSTFLKKEFLKEEKVVIEENIQYSDDPVDQLEVMTNELLQKGSSYSFPVDSLKFHKKKFDYNEILSFYHHFYHPNNVVVSIVSNFSFEKINKMFLRTYFVKENEWCPHCNNPFPCSCNFSIVYNLEPQHSILYNIQPKKELNTTHLHVSFRTCPYHDNKDKYKLEMLKHIFTGTLSSRLFVLLREENGLTYTSNVTTNYHQHTGEFIIYAEMDQHKLLKNENKKGVLPLIIQLLNDIQKDGITSAELEITKNNLKGKEILKMSNTNYHAEYNGYNYIMGEGKVDASYLKIFETHFKKISIRDLNHVFSKYFRKKNMSVCCYGGSLKNVNLIKTICETFKNH